MNVKWIASNPLNFLFNIRFLSYNISPKIHSEKGDAMSSRHQVSALAFALAGVLFLTACPSRTKIGKIIDDPARYTDKEVGIAGRVEDSYGIPFVGGAYKLDDGSGEIWVVSKRSSVPSRGAQVGAKGRVYNGFSFGGRNFGTVMEEQERKIK